MVIEEISESAKSRLCTILNKLKEDHSLALSFSGMTKAGLLEVYRSLEENRIAIKESSSFNTYHENKSYIEGSLVMEAIVLFIEGVSSDTTVDSNIGD